MQISQMFRSAEVIGPWGRDATLLLRVEVEEELGRPFEMSVDFLAQGMVLDPAEALGAPMSVRLERDDGGTRFFHGYVSRLEDLTHREDGEGWRVTLVPWLWFLSRRQDCRIFQRRNVPEIIAAVFSRYDIAEVEDRLSLGYQNRPYCVQYRETDLDFVSRLMEEEGIHYWFEHRSSGHVLVLADASTGLEATPGYESIPYFQKDEDALRERDHIDEWSVADDLQSGSYSLADYNFKAPSRNLLVEETSAAPTAQAALQVFDYPGLYAKKGAGNRYAKLRVEELQSQARRIRGAGNLRGLQVGASFRLSEHERVSPDREFRVISTRCVLEVDEYRSAASKERGALFRCEFTALDLDRPYQPPRRTELPVISGPQTAVVTGPEGQEIWTDNFGRVKLHFHWDRHGAPDEDSSCWVRVAQPWAGKGWGSLTIPRVGQEVIVEFLNGHPDRPIIVGSVYNGEQTPPQGLPAARSNMTLRSNSYPGGGGSNEITLNDTAGEEKLYIHAQYNSVEEVGNDRSSQVTNNDELEVGVDQAINVGNNRNVSIGVDDAESVGVNKTIDVGSNFVISAGTSITLKCGAASIHMNQAGVITISGTLVTMAGSINANVAAPITNVAGAILCTSTGAVNLTSGVVARVQGASMASLISADQAEVVGGGDTVIQGAKVKIN